MTEETTSAPAAERRDGSALSEGLGAGAEARDAAPHDNIGLAALLVLSHEMLAELLQLPAGCHIDHAVAPHDKPGVLHLRVRGAGWPTKAGWTLPEVRSTVTRYYADNGAALRQVIDWGFPPRNAAEQIAADTKAHLEPKLEAMLSGNGSA